MKFKKIILLTTMILLAIPIAYAAFESFGNVNNMIGDASNLATGAVKGSSEIFKNIFNPDFSKVFLVIAFGLFIIMKKAPFLQGLAEGTTGTWASLIIGAIVAYQFTHSLVIEQGLDFKGAMNSIWALCGLGCVIYGLNKHQEGSNFQDLIPIGMVFAIISAFIAPFNSLWGSTEPVDAMTGFFGHMVIWCLLLPLGLQYYHEYEKKKTKEEEKKREEEKEEEKRIEALDETENRIKEIIEEYKTKEKETEKEIKHLKEAEKNIRDVDVENLPYEEVYRKTYNYAHKMPNKMHGEFKIIEQPISTEKFIEQINKSLERKKKAFNLMNQDFASTILGKEAEYLIKLQRKLIEGEGKVWAEYTGPNFNDYELLGKKVSEESKNKRFAEKIKMMYKSVVEKRKVGLSYKEFIDFLIRPYLRNIKKRIKRLKSKLKYGIENAARYENRLKKKYVRYDEVFEEYRKYLRQMDTLRNQYNEEIQDIFKKLHMFDPKNPPPDYKEMVKALKISTDNLIKLDKESLNVLSESLKELRILKNTNRKIKNNEYVYMDRIGCIENEIIEPEEVTN